MLLKISELEKSYAGAEGPVPVLRGVSMGLDAGQTMALTGESGSGKSTLLHLAAGLDVPDQGTVHIEGAAISALDDAGRAALRRGPVGLIFQQFNLIPSLDVRANIAFHARLSGRYDPTETARLTQSLGLSAHLDKYPEHLSGGQQQRVAIARTLATRPRLVLADEPTGNLDESTAEAVTDQMLQLVAESGAGLLIVTHSDRLASRMDRRLHLSQGCVA